MSFQSALMQARQVFGMGEFPQLSSTAGIGVDALSSASALVISDELNPSTQVGSKPKVTRSSMACTHCREFRQKCVARFNVLPITDAKNSRLRRVPIGNCAKCDELGLRCVFMPRGHASEHRDLRRRCPKAFSASAPPKTRVRRRSPQEHRVAPLDDRPDSKAVVKLSAAIGQRESTGVLTSISRNRPQTEPTRDLSLPPLLPDSSPPRAPHNSSPRELQCPLNASTIHAAGLLPPLEEIVEAVHLVFSCYFQLGLDYATLFIARLGHDSGSVSNFLLTSILAISTHSSPRNQSSSDPSQSFMNRAMEMVAVESLAPSLEACQAFFLLATFHWGQGHGQKSSEMMDIAMKMSWDLRLHDETTHQLCPDTTRSQSIDTEVTRRTLWIILSHANFYPTIDRSSSGFNNLLDVTALLPCDDEAYVQGCSPITCSSLMGTVAALRSPESVFRPDQSLFASRVQVTELWAKVSRKASSIDPALHGSWKSETEFSELRLELDQWEAHLPPTHRWSPNNLKHWREQKQDLAFFATNSTLKLAYMSLHRLEVSLLASTAGVYDSQYQTSLVDRDVHTTLSWARITKMMTNEAFEAIADAKLFFSMRGPRSGCPPFLYYNVFVAAEIALYVLKCQCFDEVHATRAEATFTTGLDILLEAATTWAVAARWHAHLVEGYGNGGYPNPFESSSTLGADLLPPLKPASPGLSLPAPSYPSTGFETYDWDLTQQYPNLLQEETVSPLSSFGGFDPHSLNPLDSSSSTPLEFPSPNAVPPEYAFPSPNDLTNFSFPYLFEAELAQCSEEMAGPSQ